MSIQSKPKKKHNWMAGFILPPPSTDIDKVRRDRLDRREIINQRNNKARR
jgi:hypothetical protein